MPFVKGKSGNPGGRSQAQADIERLAREYAPQAIKALVAALADPKVKVAAAKVLLDRGFGMPKQTLEANVSIIDQLNEDDRSILERTLAALIAGAEGDTGRAAATTRLQ